MWKKTEVYHYAFMLCNNIAVKCRLYGNKGTSGFYKEIKFYRED